MHFRTKTPQSQLEDLLDSRKTARRSARKREDRSYVECPDIVIEEDYQLSKPSPAKRPNLSSSGTPSGKASSNHVGNHGGTNGIAMESDNEEEDDDDDDDSEIPTPKVSFTYSQLERKILFPLIIGK